MAAPRRGDNLAEIYSKYSSDIQRELGIKLVEFLDVKSDEKVLDMGCGTGEITSFIADQVGEKGEVDGVDPDEERIEVATQKLSSQKRNVSFIVGDSSSHFLQVKQSYYDTHFSNFVFQWLSARQQAVFVETAWRSLKPGGRVGWQCQESISEICQAMSKWFPDLEKKRRKLVDKSTMEVMLRRVGFVIEFSAYDIEKSKFPNLDDFLTWFCVSHYFDKSEILRNEKESFAKKYLRLDGTVYFETLIYRIIARKPNKNL